MQSFTYTGWPVRVVFGEGSFGRLAEEAKTLGVSRALVLSTPGQQGMAEQAATLLGDAAAGIFAGATMHTPVDVTEQALARLQQCGADGIVAVGGGSTTGLGKALALRTDLPQIVVPTTYAGSEMTSILGETEGGRKTTMRDPRIQPESVLYDVSLTLGLPVKLSVVSGLNAIAHAVEALYAPDRNPVIELMAEEGIRSLAGSFDGIVANPADVSARSDALYGAWLCGVCLGSTAMSLHHKLCHTLGGMFNLPHAETHAVLLPYALRYNAAAAPEAAVRVARALNAADAPAALQALGRRNGAPHSLRDIGLRDEDIEPAVAAAVANPYANPAPVTEAGVRDLLNNALQGGNA